MKKAFCLLFIAILLLMVPVLPLLAQVIETYCPLFPPAEYATYSQSGRTWIKSMHMNSCLVGAMVLSYGTLIGFGILSIVVYNSEE